jgi:hypothetical protein
VIKIEQASQANLFDLGSTAFSTTVAAAPFPLLLNFEKRSILTCESGRARNMLSASPRGFPGNIGD